MDICDHSWCFHLHFAGCYGTYSKISLHEGRVDSEEKQAEDFSHARRFVFRLVNHANAWFIRERYA